MNTIKVKGKIFQNGSSYGLRVNKCYVSDGNLELGQEYLFEVKIPTKVLKVDEHNSVNNAPVVKRFWHNGFPIEVLISSNYVHTKKEVAE